MHFDIENYGWLNLLFAEDGPLNVAKNDYMYTFNVLENAYTDLYDHRGYTGSVVNRLKTLKTEDIITFLVNHNLLPKYGFPVDTVNLKVQMIQM
jgi:hypothetical protein